MNFFKDNPKILSVFFCLVALLIITLTFNSYADRQRQKVAELLGSIHSFLTMEIKKEVDKIEHIEANLTLTAKGNIVAYKGYKNDFNEPLIGTLIYVFKDNGKYDKYESKDFIKDLNLIKNPKESDYIAGEYQLDEIFDEFNEARDSMKSSIESKVVRKYFSEGSRLFGIIIRPCQYNEISCEIDTKISHDAISEIIFRAMLNKTSILDELKLGQKEIEDEFGIN